MAQATYSTTTTMSAFTRRMFLGRTAAASAASAVVVVPALAGDADADLLALGRKFEPLYSEFLATHPAYLAMYEEWEKEAHELFGSGWKPTNTSDLKTMWAERDRIGAERGYEAISFAHEDLIGRIDEISRSIIEAPSSTVQGLAVKARAAACYRPDYWDQPREEMDWSEYVAPVLIENICAVAAAAPPNAPETAGC